MATEGGSFEWLPESFRNCVVEYSANNDGGFEATVRSNAARKEAMAQWLCDFELRTKTKWLVRSTFPNVQRLSYRIDYVCQHSSFKKCDTKRASKKCNCGAKLTQKVNLVTKRTKHSNPHVKVGVPKFQVSSVYLQTWTPRQTGLICISCRLTVMYMKERKQRTFSHSVALLDFNGYFNLINII